MNRTDRQLLRMFKENTGRAMCDSGDAYGRHWERNQTRDFMSEPCILWDASGVTLNAFQWLRERVEYNDAAAALNAMFFKKYKKTDGRQWADVCEFAESFKGDDEHAYGFSECNTYNGECLLDQTLQFATFEYNGGAFVVLQIHNGCDVRGGYTDGRVFEIIGGDHCVMFDFARCDIVTQDGAQRLPFYTDDAYNWYDEEGNKYEWEHVYKLLCDEHKAQKGVF